MQLTGQINLLSLNKAYYTFIFDLILFLVALWILPLL